MYNVLHFNPLRHYAIIYQNSTDAITGPGVEIKFSLKKTDIYLLAAKKFIPGSEFSAQAFEVEINKKNKTFAELQANIGPKMVFTTGCGDDYEDAIFLATMELYERLIFALYSPLDFTLDEKTFSLKDIYDKYQLPKKIWFNHTTTGCAVHTNLDQAKLNAKKELIERHVILKAMATSIAPYHIIDCDTKSFEAKYNLTCEVFCWQGPEDYYVTVAKGTSKESRGCIYGFSSEMDLAASIDDSLRELSYKAPAFLSPESTSELHHNIQAVHSYHQSQKHESIENYFKHSSQKINKVDQNLNLHENLYYHQFIIPKKLNPYRELKMIKAVCPLLQSLFFAPWDEFQLNPLAIKTEELNPIGEYSIID